MVKVSPWLLPVWYFSVRSISFLCSFSRSGLLLQTVLRMQICVLDVLLLILLLLSDHQTLGLFASWINLCPLLATGVPNLDSHSSNVCLIGVTQDL